MSSGGQHLPVGDERCTHLIVEENTVKDLPFEPSQNLYVVKQEVSFNRKSWILKMRPKPKPLGFCYSVAIFNVGDDGLLYMLEQITENVFSPSSGFGEAFRWMPKLENPCTFLKR